LDDGNQRARVGAGYPFPDFVVEAGNARSVFGGAFLKSVSDFLGGDV